MAIRTVNGQKVYVLEPTPFNVRAPSGSSWSTLYSDLRWQVWEDIQKNEASKMKLEAMSFDAQRDYYNDQKKFLQNQIADLKKIQLRASDGGADAISQSLRAAEILNRSAASSAGKKSPSGPRITERATPAYNDFGEPIIDESTGKQLINRSVSVSRPALPGEINPATGEPFAPGSFVSQEIGGGGGGGGQIPSSVKELGEAVVARGLQTLKGGGEGAAAAPTTIEDEIAKLEGQLSGLQSPQLDMDTDLLNRSQRAFESQVGVMGAGGGIFGLAPRPRREAPRVDQPLARQRADEFISAVEAERSARETAGAQLAQLYGQKRGLLQDESLSPIAKQRSSEALDAQIAALQEGLSGPTFVEQALSDPRFKERKAGEFLLRRAEADFLGVPSEELVSEMPTPSQPPAPSPRDQRAIEAADKALEVSRSPTGRRPLLDTFRLPTLDASGMPIEPVEMAIPRGRVEVGPPIAQPPRAPTAQPLTPQTTAPSITPIPPQPPAPPRLDRGQSISKEQAVKEFQIQYGPIKVNLDTGSSEMVPVDPKVNEQIYKSFIEEGPSFESDAAGRTWYQNKLKEVTAPPQASKPTSKQRKDLYALTITADGLKLSQQPKKLERLARTKEDTSSRPSHYTLVDQIYDINKGKSNAFKASFDEISRVFANDPQKRKEAHTYLVAKDSLEVGKAEPQV